MRIKNLDLGNRSRVSVYIYLSTPEKKSNINLENRKITSLLENKIIFRLNNIIKFLFAKLFHKSGKNIFVY